MLQAYSLLRITGIAVCILTLGISGCSSGNGAKTDGLGGDGKKNASELNTRVVDAVAPISSASLASEKWLTDLKISLRVPALKSCLEEAGRPDLEGAAIQYIKAFNATNLQAIGAGFADLKRIAAEGFAPP